VQTRTIAGVDVSAIGLGAMEFSVEGHPPYEQAIRTIHAALDAGVRLIDTADAYTPDPGDMGHNERIVADALGQWGGDRDTVLVATKGGSIRTPNGGWGRNGRPDYLKAACERSLKALGVESIGLYQHHRPDEQVPYEETLGALKELLDAGKIRAVGISNADPAQIELAASIVPLAAVQNEFSPRFTSSYRELRLCAERGIAFLPWSPLGGMGKAAQLGGHLAAFAAVAQAHGVSAQQVCLAWELALAPVVIPIPGCSRPETILSSAAAADLRLTDDEVAQLSADLPAS
jgi:aryl-alcohol dehydrogenase-like predicted oxidoreductase